MLDGFCKKKSSKFVGHPLSLELCACLLVVPIIKGKFSDINVQAFGHQWTGGDGAV